MDNILKKILNKKKEKIVNYKKNFSGYHERKNERGINI